MSSNERIAPTIEPSPRGTRITHPAFGQIRANRVNGCAVLYGSDFEHHAFVTITIAKSDMQRDLSHDWPYAHTDLIEVALSEAQWATFVSSMNVGLGTPCTLTRYNRQSVPGITLPKNTADQFRQEADAKLGNAIAALDELVAQISETGLPKGKAEALKAKARRARQDLADNLPFVAKSFDEHMERTVETAKVEVNAYMTGVVQRAGIAALADGLAPPLALEYARDEEER